MAVWLGRSRGTVRAAANRPAQRPTQAPADSEVGRYESYPSIEME